MLSQEGVPPARAASGMTAASAIVFGTLLLINVLALPLVVLGVAVPAKLLAAAWVSAVLLLGIVLIGYFAFSGDRFLTAVGRGAQWTINKLRRRSQPVQDLPGRLLAQRTAVAEAVGGNWWQALLASAGKWVFDYLTLVFALGAVGAHPNARAGARRLRGGIASRTAPDHARRARRGRGRPHRHTRTDRRERRRCRAGHARVPALQLLALPAGWPRRPDPLQAFPPLSATRSKRVIRERWSS